MWMILGHNRLLSGRRRILCILILCVFFLCLKSLWDSFESGQGGEGRGGEERRIDGAIVSIQKAQCFPFNWNPIHEFKVENVLAGPNQKALIGRCRVSMMLVACFNCICSLMATSQTAKPINRSLELFSRFSSGFIYFFSFHSLCLSSFILFGFSIYFISFCLFFFFSFLFLFFEELIPLLGSAAADMNRRRMCIWLVTKWRRVAIFVDSTPSAAVQVKRGGNGQPEYEHWKQNRSSDSLRFEIHAISDGSVGAGNNLPGSFPTRWRTMVQLFLFHSISCFVWMEPDGVVTFIAEHRPSWRASGKNPPWTRECQRMVGYGTGWR